MEASTATKETETTPAVPIYGVTRYETLILSESLGEHGKEHASLAAHLDEYGQNGYSVAGVMPDGCIILQRPVVSKVS